MIATSEHSPTTHWYTDKNSFADWLLEVANTANPPLVISISYGAGEDTVSSGEFDAFNFQAVKLGLMGITILVSSGGNTSTIPAANNLAYTITILLYNCYRYHNTVDDGVLSHSARMKKDRCAYVPSFPASSPYVTAIGATQVT
jgi:tripeptidyl-peptidase I